MLLLMVEDMQAFAAGGGLQPPTQSLGELHSVGVFGEFQPGHLYRVERAGLVQPKRLHRRGDEPTVPAHEFITGCWVTVVDPHEQVSIAVFIGRCLFRRCLFRCALMLRSAVENPLDDLRWSAVAERAPPVCPARSAR
jgi:hypothetical protein